MRSGRRVTTAAVLAALALPPIAAPPPFALFVMRSPSRSASSSAAQPAAYDLRRVRYRAFALRSRAL